MTITTEQQAREAERCEEITGDLSVRSPTLERLSLPKLQRIHGLLLALGDWPLRELTLPKLREVGSSPDDLVEIGFGLRQLERISLPELHKVDGSFGIAALAGLTDLDISSLEEISNNFGLVNLPRLTHLKHSEQLQADGRFALELLCHVPSADLPDTSTQDPEQLSLRDLSCCVDPQSCKATLCACTE